ncbi:MAG: MFS transporter [Lentisphaeraceae bacterium]|nr:MFS transporter [Lentisphaeraceae bacterium]
MIPIFKPAPKIERLPKAQIKSHYKLMRLKIFLGIFIGYAGYYLVRKNINFAMPYLLEMGYSKTQLGFVASGIPISYGLSKFFMGSISDRSNPRMFMAAGLFMSSVIMIVFGTVPAVIQSIPLMFSLLLLNGWVQGMGWPPCGKTVVNWFSVKERGVWMSLWNTSHNIGGGIIAPIFTIGFIIFADWRCAFYAPAIVAMIISLIILILVRDKPQSVGLPSIEKFKKIKKIKNKKMSYKELYAKILNNRCLWYIALANAFVYFVRYGVGDWIPTYLKEVKGFSIQDSGWAYMIYEYAGIPGTILCGWISDRIFQGRRSPAAILYMLGVLIAIIVYWQNPPGNTLIDMLALSTIGFLIYGPVMLIALHALDLVPKNAAGTAAGFTGLFGYLIGAVAATSLMGILVDYFDWKGGFIALIIACIGAIFFLALTWKLDSELHKKKKRNSSMK